MSEFSRNMNILTQGLGGEDPSRDFYDCDLLLGHVTELRGANILLLEGKDGMEIEDKEEQRKRKGTYIKPSHSRFRC